MCSCIDKNFHNPRTYSGTISYERELIANLTAFATFTHSKTVHVTRFINRNDAVFGTALPDRARAQMARTASAC